MFRMLESFFFFCFFVTQLVFLVCLFTSLLDFEFVVIDTQFRSLDIFLLAFGFHPYHDTMRVRDINQKQISLIRRAHLLQILFRSI